MYTQFYKLKHTAYGEGLNTTEAVEYVYWQPAVISEDRGLCLNTAEAVEYVYSMGTVSGSPLQCLNTAEAVEYVYV